VKNLAEVEQTQTFVIQLAGAATDPPGSEMQEAMKAVAQATGAAKVDLVVDSSASKETSRSGNRAVSAT
jgi:hypothetical protein